MSLLRVAGLALVSGLVACAHPEQPTTPPFASQLPPLPSGFAELDDKSVTVDPCADLAAAASMEFTEVPDGAAIELLPRAGRDKNEVEGVASRVEEAFLPGVSDAERASCRIFDPSDEVNVHLSNAVSGTRLVFETFNRKKVPAVRARVKAFAAEHGPK